VHPGAPTPHRAVKDISMKKEQIIQIAEGLRLIEDGVERIQSAMREANAKSIKEIAEKLIPIFQKDDDSLSESIIKHIG
jgi:hypothetical protein